MRSVYELLKANGFRDEDGLKSERAHRGLGWCMVFDEDPTLFISIVKENDGSFTFFASDSGETVVDDISHNSFIMLLTRACALLEDNYMTKALNEAKAKKEGITEIRTCSIIPKIILQIGGEWK